MSQQQDFDLIIEPGKSFKHYWRDIYQFRSLFYFLSWRDFLVRYKQTVIGILWALLRPLLTILVFTYIFGNVAGLNKNSSTPYILIVCCAMMPWQFFANAFSESGNSLIANANLLSKVYFPRIIVPVSSIVVSFIDFLISLVILAALFIYYGYWPSSNVWMVFIFLLQAFVICIGAGCWVAALNVRYRDFRYIIPFIVQFGLYISPIGFTSNVIDEKWKMFFAINPMVGVIEGFRYALLGNEFYPGNIVFLISLVSTFVILFCGWMAFRKMEKSFADII